MQCPSCGRENLADATFCSGCGSGLSLSCHQCGRNLAPDASFCDACGTRVGTQAPVGSPADLAPALARTDEPTSFADGRYQVKKLLGEGGKKRVYLAHDSTLDRDVALAVIKTEGLDETSRERITREARAVGRLGGHPHILTIYDFGEESSQPYMVLPLIAGDVEGLIDDAPDHRIPLEQALDHYPDERAEALEHLDFAIGELRDMKIQPSLERALSRRDILKA